MRIVFVRHGHPDYARDCLTELGHRHADAAARRLEGEGISRIFSSTCGRALETARHLADVLGLPVVRCDFMREISWGAEDGGALPADGHPWTLADEMIAACKENGKLLMYAEELCFAPKYERVRAIVEKGALGKLYMLKQCEKHSGPHSRWFYESDKSGGGVMMDMGCHALAWFRWMLKGNAPTAVYGNFMRVMHDTDAEDHAITQLEFEIDGRKVVCVGEDSWAKHGGMQDCIEVYGDEGVCYADLFQGNSSQMYSLNGYDYASEKAGATTGWTFPIFEEAFNQGYPQELGHFIDCVRTGKQPLVTGEDGRAVLEIIHAAYLSAKTGQRVALPFRSEADKPVDLWR